MQSTITTHLPFAAAFLVLPGLAGAQASTTGELSAREFAALPVCTDASRVLGSGYLSGLDRQVYFDQPGDGSIWAVGETYKASFDASGPTYVPFFGSAAPRNFPVRFEITEVLAGGERLAFDPAAQPILRGEQVVFDRGALLETYDLRVDSMEQLFVFEAPTRPGDLVVRLAVHSELRKGSDAAGLVLAGDHGSVRYSSAVAVDARGARKPAPTSWKDGSIEIRVPAETLAQVRWPLVIDPLVTSFSIDSTTSNDLWPDVAYDVTNNRYLAVYERAFSSTDHDIYSRFVSSTGVPSAATWVDATNDYWGKPKVANNNLANQFFIVAEVSDPSSPVRAIAGRTQAASTGLLGTHLWILFTFTSDDYCIHPDVGGDPKPTASPLTGYCVVWERAQSATNHDIQYCIVYPDLQVTPIQYLDGSLNTFDEAPSISKSNGLGVSPLQAWNVVWTRKISSQDHDLFGRQIAPDGSTVTPTFPIDTTTANTTEASPTSPTADSPRRWMVAYTVSNVISGSYQIFGKLMEGSTVLDSADLTLLSGAVSSEDQTQPSADCDGTLFVVANKETVAAAPGTSKIKVSTFSMLGNKIALAEGNVAMTTTSSNDLVEVATTGSAGGSIHRTLLAWRNVVTAGDGNIRGAFYDASPFTLFCQPGSNGVIACPCGNAPTLQPAGCNNSNNTGGAFVTAQGGVFPDSVTLNAGRLRPNATCIFLQGNALLAAGTAFGDGVRCVGGTLKRLYVKSATAAGGAVAPAAGDLSITARSAAIGDPIAPGTKRWYQTYYRDPVAYACASPATFNITGAVQIDW